MVKTHFLKKIFDYPLFKMTNFFPTGYKNPSSQAQDLLDSMYIEEDIEHLKTLYNQLLPLAVSEKQREFYTSWYEKIKFDLDEGFFDDYGAPDKW